jgi:hypothetical protein
MRASQNVRGLLGGAAVGVAATVTMDVVMVAAAKLAPGIFASEKNSPEAIGRWAAGLCRGRRSSEDLSAEPPGRGAAWSGRAAHYLTGVTLTEVYLAGLRRSGVRPGVAGATVYGIATAVLPLLVMYPSMGYGCWGRRSGDVRRLVGSMLLGHTAFGAGIGLWAAATRQTG